MVTWFAGLFYLPRLFVYHVMSDDQISIDRFKIMERKLFFGIATPGAVLTLLFGTWTLILNGWEAYAGTLWIPSMNIRWAKKNKTMMGSTLIQVAAIIQAKFIKP